jgi:hypothetical protein
MEAAKTARKSLSNYLIIKWNLVSLEELSIRDQYPAHKP